VTRLLIALSYTVGFVWNDEAGIPIASATMDLTITSGGVRTTRESSRSG
jgi:hypothetical protein